MQQASSTVVPVAIIGGGLVGLALANALAQSGVEVVVVDQSDFQTQNLPAFDGRVSAVSYASRILLENIGAWQGMAPQAQPILDIRVAEKGMPAFVHYDHREVGEYPMGHIIENRHIRQSLQERAKRHHPRIRFIMPARWRNYEETPGYALITLDSGEKIKASLVIAADGKFSGLRKHAGIESVGYPYGQTAIVATICHQKPHHGLAVEYFLPAGPFAILPMQKDRSSLVWVERDADAALYMKLDRSTLEAEIARRIGEHLGSCRLEGEVFSYPLSLGLAKQYYKGRIALIGDAAHAMHPIAGQGVNLGFRDVAVLAEVIVEAMRRGQDPASDGVLAAYQQWRRFDSVTLLAVTDALNRMFSNRNKGLKLLRNLGFSGVNQLNPVKHLFMRHAMGIMGDLPPLMQPDGGKSLRKTG